MVDVSMTDGALSWLAMVAARYFAEQRVPHRGEPELTGGIACYVPYETKDGRLGLAGRARAEVLAELVQRGGASRPDREAVRAS